MVKIWKWLQLLNSVPFIKKTLVNHLYIWILIILTDFPSFKVNEDKLQNYPIWRFLLRSEYVIEVRIWKWLKLLNSVPFIKKTLVSQVYIRIWSFWLTLTVLHWMKKNCKISQFSKFLLRSRHAILVKIWKWLKLLNSVQFMKKPIVKHLYIWISIILTDFHSITENEDKLQNWWIWRFLLRSEYTIQVKIWKWLKVVNSVPFSKKTLVNHLYIWIWSFWLTFTALQWMKTNFKISQFEDFCKGPSMRFRSKFEND